MRNYFNYFTEVEEHFVRKRGKNLLVSPLDWCLIELWRDEGIPLHIVLRGIERSFESAEQKRKKSPNSLFYCHPAILEAFEEYQRAMLGANPEEATGEGVQAEQSSYRNAAVKQRLEEVELGLRGLSSPVFVRAADRVAALQLEASKLSVGQQERLDRDLVGIGAEVARALKDELDPAQLKELELEVQEEMKIYARRLSKQMREHLGESYLHRKILSRFDLPDFSLLGIGSGPG